MAAVDQPFIPEAHEHLAHRARVGGVEGEARPAPVAGAADDLELLEDRVTCLAHEFPHPRHKGLAAQIEPRLAFFRELLLDDVLSRDAGVIGPGQPFSRPTAQPLEAHQDILDDVVQPVPHVQHGGDIGWRNDDDVRLGLGPRLEDARIEPALIDGGFYGPRIVCHSLI